MMGYRRRWTIEKKGAIEMTERTKSQAALATCPECGDRIQFKCVTWMGMQVTCPHRDAHLKVINTGPVELDRADVRWGAYDDFDEDEEGPAIPFARC